MMSILLDTLGKNPKPRLHGVLYLTNQLPPPSLYWACFLPCGDFYEPDSVPADFEPRRTSASYLMR